MDENKNDEIIDIRSSQSNLTSDKNKSISSNWMEKLKPSNKNKLILQKYKNLSPLTPDTDNKNYDLNIDQNKKNEEIISVEKNQNKNNFPIENIINLDSLQIIKNPENKIQENSILNKNSTNENLKKRNSENLSKNSSDENENKSYLAKWNKCVFENRPNLVELNTIQDQSQVILKNHNDNTALSDDIEKINNIMEERIKLNLCENGFLKQPYHSIIPFILIQNKEIHRMCLSDYELKLFYKTYNKKKSESERKNPYESYRQGIIKFYKGKYLDAYSNFKSAYMKKENDLNIVKWLAFTSIILLMCNKKIDFLNIKKVKVEISKEESDVKENNVIFPCCSSRKIDGKIRSLRTNSIHNNFQFNNIKSYFGDDIINYNANSGNFNISKISQINLAKEITKLLKILVRKENKKEMNVNNSNNFNLEESCTVDEFKNVSHEIEAW